MWHNIPIILAISNNHGMIAILNSWLWSSLLLACFRIVYLLLLLLLWLTKIDIMTTTKYYNININITIIILLIHMTTIKLFVIIMLFPHPIPIPWPPSCRVVDVRRRGREARHLDRDLQGARGARCRDDGLTQCAVRDLVEDHLQPRKRGSWQVFFVKCRSNIWKYPWHLDWYTYIHMLVYDMYIYI